RYARSWGSSDCTSGALIAITTPPETDNGHWLDRYGQIPVPFEFGHGVIEPGAQVGDVAFVEAGDAAVTSAAGVGQTLLGPGDLQLDADALRLHPRLDQRPVVPAALRLAGRLQAVHLLVGEFDEPLYGRRVQRVGVGQRAAGQG